MTEKKSLTTYKAETIELVKAQINNIKTSYNLVRLNNVVVVGQSNKSIVAEMLMELNEFTNVSRKMSEGQIVETVNILLDEYPRLSLQEYQVFFNRIRSGKFGQLYESLDGIKIMAFMKDFYQEVLNAYHEFKEEKHNQIKRDEQHRDL